MNRAQLLAQAKRKHLIEQAKAKHAAQGGEVSAPAEPAAPKVIDEMHPDLDWKDRFLFKAFSTDPEDAQARMQQKYPEHEFERDDTGDLQMRKKGEPSWRKVDPRSMSLKEFGRDGLDLLYDIVDGGVTTAATVAGGLAGLPAGPLGVVAGGAAGSAASSGAMEGIRQSLGKATGFTQEYDPLQLGIATGAGAVSPLLFGQGASVKGAAKHLLKKGMAGDVAQETAEQFVKQGQGIIPKVAGKIGNATTAKLGAFANGHSAEGLRKLQQKMRSGLMDSAPATVARETKAKLSKKMAETKTFLGEQRRELLGQMDVKINSREVEQPLFDLLSKYKKQAELDSPGFEKMIAKGKKPQSTSVDEYLYLQKQVNKNMKRGREITGEEIPKYRRRLSEMAEQQKNTDLGKKQQVDKDFILASSKSRKILNNQLEASPVGRQFRDIDDQFQEAFADEDIVKRYLKDDAATNRSLRNFDSEAEVVRKDDISALGKKYGVDFDDAANDTYFLQKFINPTDSASHIRSTGATARAGGLGLLGGAAGYYAGQHSDTSPFLMGSLGAALGSRAGSNRAIKNYIRVGNAARNAADATAPIRRVGREVLWDQLQEK